MNTRLLYISMKNRNIGFRPHNSPSDPNQTIFKVYIKEGEIGSIHIPHRIFDSAVFIVDAASKNVLINRGKLIRDDNHAPIQVVDMRPLPKCSDASFLHMTQMQDAQNEHHEVLMDLLVEEFVPDEL